jgi:hypothetical protein
MSIYFAWKRKGKYEAKRKVNEAKQTLPFYFIFAYAKNLTQEKRKEAIDFFSLLQAKRM